MKQEIEKRHYLTDKELKRLQEIELELLVEFDRICRKHRIKYSIDGGTLLGAVRHGGFIPWDDDADVIMVRDEYNKFKSVVKIELDKERFYLQDMDSVDGYRWGYAKLRKKRTQFVRINQEHMPYEQGIFMDIFICDNVPDNYYHRCVCNAVSFIYRKFFWSEVGRRTESGLKKFSFSLMARIPEAWIKSSYRRYVVYRNKKGTQWVKCLTFPACNRTYGYKRDWYENVTDIKFSDKVFLGPVHKEEYLEFLYGDYMKLPPVENRKEHPVSRLVLDGESLYE